MNLDESGLLELSMELQNKFTGLLNNEESIINQSLNSSNIEGKHRRKYSEENSVIFGEGMGNDTFSLDIGGNKILGLDTSNILNMKQLKEEDEEIKKPSFDQKKREEELKKLFENKEINVENKTRNVWGLRNDTNPESEVSQEQFKSQEEDNGVFNPFKCPVVPGVVQTPSNSDSQRDSSQSEKEGTKSPKISSENKPESSDIKFVNAQYAEWNKRIREATQDNYFNDSATKVMRKKPMNPLDKLTPEGMRDIKINKNKESYHKNMDFNPSKTSLQVSDQEFLGSQDLEVAQQDPTTIFGSFATVDNQTAASSSEEREMMKQVMKMEIILIMINCDLVSDFEVSRSKKYLKDFLTKNPECFEVHYGLSQVYFSLGCYHSALEEINIAMTHQKSDIQYMIWKALYLYYIFKTIIDLKKRIEALRK